MTPQLHLLESYGREFQSQLHRINAFVKHPSAIGTAHEGIVRRFLQRYIPKRLAVSEGFIIDAQNKPSKQCDIIIWSHLDFSPYHQEGDFVIVPAAAVKAVIEVKTKLDKKFTKEAFQNLHAARKASSNIYTAIFAFGSVRIRTFIRYIISKEYQELTDSTNSIFTMNGRWLQRTKHVVSNPAYPHMLDMETHPKVLNRYNEPITLMLILPPATKPLAYALGEFLVYLFIALDIVLPFGMSPGPTHQGYIFPGYGVKIYSDRLSSEDEEDTLLDEIRLRRYFKEVEQIYATIKREASNSSEEI